MRSVHTYGIFLILELSVMPVVYQQYSRNQTKQKATVK
jgi:hypothetical protein